MDVSDLQEALHEWRTRNFPMAEETQQFIGLVEEVGELAHAHLKDTQRIRGTPEEHEAAAKDAIGDILIYLAGYCSYVGWNMLDIYELTAEQVMQRDWIANPHDGT